MQKTDSPAFALLLGGDLTPAPRLKRQLAGLPVIAADCGMRHAAALGLAPLLWLGDFDTAGAELQKRFAHVPQQHFPRDKDKTDGELAAEAAIARGAKRLIFCGAFGGGRPDHSLMHMTMALALAKKGLDCLLTDGVSEGAPLLPGRDYEFALAKGAPFSFIGLSNIAGLNLSGAKWNLANARLRLGSSLAVANESCGIVRISMQKGYGILLMRPRS